MNKPITPKQMKQWTKQAWQKAQDDAWERTKKQLEQPEVMAVLKRMKDR